jgi:hypothetical protein
MAATMAAFTEVLHATVVAISSVSGRDAAVVAAYLSVRFLTR